MGTYLTKGTTFTTGATVTAASLNNLVDNATVTAGSIGSTQLGADSVVNGKIIDSATGAEPVTTGTIRDNAISNAKLAQMAAKTVKANATNGAADSTDVPVAVSELLAGTATTINALSFTTDLEMVDSSDVVKTDNTAAKIRVAANLIGGKASVTADELDEILIKDADDGALKRATVKTAVQSQVASTVATGVCELATAAKLFDSSGAVANDVISAATGSPMLAKAWCTFTSNIAAKSTAPAAGQVTTVTSSAFNVAVGDHTTDGTSTTTGGVRQTGVGTYKVTFTTAMPNTNYIVIGNGWQSADSKDAVTVGTFVALSKNVGDFTFTTAANTSVYPNAAFFQLVVFALG